MTNHSLVKIWCFILLLSLKCCVSLTSLSPHPKVRNELIFRNHDNLHGRQNVGALFSDNGSYDDNRLESIKSGSIALVSGSVIAIIPAVIIGYFTDFNAQWEFSRDALALSLFLFGVTYRYCIRTDTKNTQLSNGFISAFAIVRALNMVQTPDGLCTSIPLNCGPPFYVFDSSMLVTGLTYLLESFIAFGGAAMAIQFALSNSYLKAQE